MNFDVKKDTFFSVIFYSLFALLFGLLFFIVFDNNLTQKWIGVLALSFSLLFLIWIWYGTSYKIDNNILNILSGPIKKNIPVRTITKIEIGKTMWVGYKLGLSKGGLIIHYNQYDEIYITPKNQKKFIDYLKRIHSKIDIHKNIN